jgi:hypothetical protein
MNESNPPIVSVEPAAPTYKDRSTGLVVFGILTILLGGLCALLLPLMLFGQVMAARTNPGSANLAAMVPGMAVYGFLAVALVWLGIGSIRARRWARALLLIFSWSWLVMGIFMLIGVGLIMPKLFANMAATAPANQPGMPGAMELGVIVFMLLFFGVFFILAPAIWIYFYNSRQVKATCEARDIVTRWTDACPLPVLGLCLWLAFPVPMMLLMPLMGHIAMPFFGVFLTGGPGMLFCLMVAAIWGYAAWLVYHLKPQGWWLILVALVVFLVSGLLTFARHDVLEMYQLMGYPQAQIDQMQKTGLLTGNRMGWLMGLSALPFLGYLFFVKKYFRGKS